MIAQIEEIRKRLYNVEAKRDFYVKEIDKSCVEMEKAEAKELILKKASSLLQQCSIQLRESMVGSIEETVTWAVKNFLDGDWSFKTHFAQKRSQWECTFQLIDPRGNENDLKYGSGRGMSDVVAFSLFVMFSALFNKNSRLPIVLDEPIPYLGTEVEKTAERAVAFLKNITERLNMQIIMITHQTPLVEAGDRAYYFEDISNTSKVTDITVEKLAYNA